MVMVLVMPELHFRFRIQRINLYGMRFESELVMGSITSRHESVTLECYFCAVLHVTNSVSSTCFALQNLHQSRTTDG